LLPTYLATYVYYYYYHGTYSEPCGYSVKELPV
jgi:hypothetical protein